ncbi:hypothetical protein CEP52_010869 [Fusarium oligoseptatum]|uniref:DUF7580 domain-containing protein n=1 Tax=Fusarium oligoseptatum TaxID=2604345 RepID=A0A428T684_9HYPO|nr:hypothetical protein CEP52_010869 [Fusarium oligoseptatum]
MDSIEYAIKASDRLLAIAESLCKDKSCLQFCAHLQAALAGITEWLQTLPKNEESKGVANLLLYQLEGLCRSPDSPQHATSAEEFCPLLRGLMAGDMAVVTIIRNLASSESCKLQRRTALACLESFLPQAPEKKLAISPSDADIRAVSGELSDYGREIVSLHQALFAHCCCGSQKVLAHIKLHQSEQDDTNVTFGVTFKAHPHNDGCDLDCHPWWQDTHISIERAVTFEGHDARQHQQVGLDPDHSFCTYISGQEEDGPLWLYFLVRGRSLYFERSIEMPKLWKLKRPSISLGRLLEEIHGSPNLLTEKMKEVLSWLLAKAVWQYYSSPWMREPWNKESVHFLFERRRTNEGEDLTGIFVNDPLLSVSIVPNPSKNDPSHQLAPVGRRLGRLLHPTPKILALGVLLVEIQLGQPIESLYDSPEWSLYCPEGKPHRNTNLQICKAYIAKPDFFDNISTPLENLIRNCIKPNDLFAPPRVRDEEGIREALYGLVNCLDVYISNLKPNKVKPLSLPQISSPRKKEISQSTAPLAPTVPPAPPVSSPARRLVPPRVYSSQPGLHPPKTTVNAFENA